MSFGKVLGLERLTGAKLMDFRNLLVECGAQHLGQSRVWVEPGREVVKDSAYSVTDLVAFIDALEAKL